MNSFVKCNRCGVYCGGGLRCFFFFFLLRRLLLAFFVFLLHCIITIYSLTHSLTHSLVHPLSRMASLSNELLNVIRGEFPKLRMPDASSKVYNDECVFSFDK
jgi:hypothetical protein